jgi:hypothetical protein
VSFSYDYSQQPGKRRRRRKARHPIIGAVVGGAVLILRIFGAFHSGQHDDPGPIESAIVSDSSGQAVSAKCPSNIGFNTSTDFTCDVSLSDGAKATVDVSWDHGKYTIGDIQRTSES